MMIGSAAAPAAAARAIHGVSKKPRMMPNAGGTRLVSKASGLQIQFLTSTNLSDLLYDFLAASGVDEITELGQLFQIDICIRYDHPPEVVRILIFVNIPPVKADH